MVNPQLLRVVGGIAAAGLAGLVGKKLLAQDERRLTVQRAFERFHERIRHEQFGERDLLRERREILLARLKQTLNPDLSPRLFAQGSYALQTGVKSITGSGFDLDMGLVLQCRRTDLPEPIEAKQDVRDALRHGSRRVRIRRSCVTVEYTDTGLGDFHVDLAVYVQEPDGKLYLAKGKEHSDPKYVFWEPAAPEELTRLLNSRGTGAELAQFRRCVRYLKRWKQVGFETRMPHSIALTIAAHRWFKPKVHGFWKDSPDDLQALLHLMTGMLTSVEGGRLQVLLPVGPGTDLMERLTAMQMQRFLDKLSTTRDVLARAAAAQPETALAELGVFFGSDF